MRCMVTLSLEDNGAFSYTPDPDFSGEDSFTYRIDTGAGSSTPALVTLIIAAVDEDLWP